MKDLGFKKVRVYDSSWLGYGNTLDAPAENVTFFNVGALNGHLAGMQKHIDALEKQLAEAKTTAVAQKQTKRFTQNQRGGLTAPLVFARTQGNLCCFFEKRVQAKFSP